MNTALNKDSVKQEKAGKVGFEWDHAEQVWDKVKEEMDELREAISLNDPARIEEEFGDLSFSLFLEIGEDVLPVGARQLFQQVGNGLLRHRIPLLKRTLRDQSRALGRSYGRA